MTVWIVTIERYMETDEILGVFASYEDALNMKKSCELTDNKSYIKSYEVIE